MPESGWLYFITPYNYVFSDFKPLAASPESISNLPVFNFTKLKIDFVIFY